MQQALSICASGMVNAVGMNSDAACAAIRCGLSNAQETRFADSSHEWILGHQVALEKPWIGVSKLVHMLAGAITDCLTSAPDIDLAATPLLICLSEPDRPARPEGLAQKIFTDIQQTLGFTLHSESGIIERGGVGVYSAIKHARRWLTENPSTGVLIAGVDSLLSGPVLKHYEQRQQLLTSIHSDGFIPGEAAAVVLVKPAHLAGAGRQLLCTGIGGGVEKATQFAEIPLRGDGLVTAVKAALAEANCTMGDLDYRMTDLSGEQYYFKEAELTLLRTLRERKSEFDILHPSENVGEVGAAIGPTMLAVLLTAMQKGYSIGNNVLCHLAHDSGQRAALVMRYQTVN